MPYSGFLALIVLAFIGVLIGIWSQRRGEADQSSTIEKREDKRTAPVSAETQVESAKRSVPAELDPAIIAVITAAVAAASSRTINSPLFRHRDTTSLWVQSNRQEQVRSMSVNQKWR